VGSSCVCERGYTGENCDVFSMECAHRCERCSGPNISDCVECIDNSGGLSCDCDVHWSGELCDVYNGRCDYKCNSDAGCIGPGAT
jgi:hypothetical protein